jgi:hypothetical protein
MDEKGLSILWLFCEFYAKNARSTIKGNIVNNIWINSCEKRVYVGRALDLPEGYVHTHKQNTGR